MGELILDGKKLRLLSIGAFVGKEVKTQYRIRNVSQHPPVALAVTAPISSFPWDSEIVYKFDAVDPFDVFSRPLPPKKGVDATIAEAWKLIMQT